MNCVKDRVWYFWSHGAQYDIFYPIRQQTAEIQQLPLPYGSRVMVSYYNIKIDNNKNKGIPFDPEPIGVRRISSMIVFIWHGALDQLGYKWWPRVIPTL